MGETITGSSNNATEKCDPEPPNILCLLIKYHFPVPLRTNPALVRKILKHLEEKLEPESDTDNKGSGC